MREGIKQRAIIYKRVSSDEQVEKGRSLEVQEANCRKCAREKGYDVVAVFTDNGVSGKDLFRPGIQQALGMLAHGEGDVLLVADFDRVTRELEDKCHIAKLMKQQGWTVDSLAETIDIDTAQGNLHLNMKVMFSQYEREMARERTCRVLNAKKERGEKLGGILPYGYREEKIDGVKYLVPDTHEQRVIRLICAWRDSGMSLAAVCRELRRRKIKSRGGNTDWNQMTVSRLLRRKGITTDRKTRSDKGKKRLIRGEERG